MHVIGGVEPTFTRCLSTSQFAGGEFSMRLAFAFLTLGQRGSKALSCGATLWHPRALVALQPEKLSRHLPPPPCPRPVSILTMCDR